MSWTYEVSRTYLVKLLFSFLESSDRMAEKSPAKFCSFTFESERCFDKNKCNECILLLCYMAFISLSFLSESIIFVSAIYNIIINCIISFC